ncbi:MAG: YciI family protein [Nevskiaceae bacterium]
MKYLCLAYEEERTLNALSPAEWDALRIETLEYVAELQGRGQLLSAEPLQSVSTATTVRVRNGKVSMTDGPFAETKETLGGFFMVEAPDLDAALAIAAKWPSARFGSIEVRPVDALLPQERRYRVAAPSSRSPTAKEFRP